MRWGGLGERFVDLISHSKRNLHNNKIVRWSENVIVNLDLHFVYIYNSINLDLCGWGHFLFEWFECVEVEMVIWEQTYMVDSFADMYIYIK